jgi:hypothetical protein
MSSPFGRLAVAQNFYVAALPYNPQTMPPAGQGGRYMRGSAGFAGVPEGYTTPLLFQGRAQGGGMNATRPAYIGSTESPEDLSTYEQIGTVAGSMAAQQESRRLLYKKQVDLAALQRARAAMKPWQVTMGMAQVVDWQIARTEADIRALEEKLAIQVEGEESWRLFRGFGQAGSVIAIVAGVAGVALLATALAKAIKSRKTNPKKRRKSTRRR